MLYTSKLLSYAYDLTGGENSINPVSDQLLPDVKVLDTQGVGQDAPTPPNNLTPLVS